MKKVNATKQIQLPRKLYEMVKHFISFNAQMGLVLDEKLKVAVAISGGVDSVALVDLLQLSGVVDIRLLHVDHGTRDEIIHEHHLIKEFAKSMGLDFLSLKLDLDLNMPSFENEARKARYQILLKNLKQGELLLTGHHLDDCFEWSLMQQFKSSAKAIDLGIPYANGRLRRPLFAFSKSQIKSFATLRKLKWLEDKSNDDLKFERNFIRNIITNQIAPRYPKYLKHYCSRMNKLKSLNDTKSNYPIFTRRWGVLIKHRGVLDQALEEEILSHSHISRGKTRDQFNKLAELMVSPKIGPLVFSGGIKVYAFGEFIAVVKKGHQLSFTNKATQIPDGIPFMSQQKCIKGSLKICPLDNESLKQVFSSLTSPVHYSWRKEGKVLVWL